MQDSSSIKEIQVTEAIDYENQIINDYNNSNDKWNLFNEKILVVVVIKNDDVWKNETRQKLYIQNLSHLSDLHQRLCDVLMRIEKKSTCWLYNVKRIEQCLKLKIPSKVLNYLFERFANRVNFKNEDFSPKKDVSNPNKSSTFENNNFVHFCIVVYSTLRDLYGDDSLKGENFKRSIEDLFSDKSRYPGFLKLVGKLSVLDNFYDCCNNIENINFDSSFENRFHYFRNLMQQASLRMVPDKANKKIKIAKLEPKKESTTVNIMHENKNLNLKTGYNGKIEYASETIAKLNAENKIRENKTNKSDKINRINPNSVNNKPPISLSKIFLLIGIIITFLVFLCFLLNAVLGLISIINFFMSVIFTVAAFILFLLQIFIAYKTDTIRLYKLCCCIKSDNKSLFNMRRNSIVNETTLENTYRNNLEK